MIKTTEETKAPTAVSSNQPITTNGNGRPFEPVEKEWTLMFYFASDNPLAPNVVPQLKAIKNAGFHQEINVVAQFDPQTEGIATHIFDVNRVNKLEDPSVRHDIGFSKKALGIRNLVLDKLWRDEINDAGIAIKTRVSEVLKRRPRPIRFDAPTPPDPKTIRDKDPANGKTTGTRSGNNTEAGGAESRDSGEPDPELSLSSFLEFCAQAYPAKHYMLFILGHGLVVGNDMFLFDEHAAKQSLRLKELASVLDGFNTLVKAEAQKPNRTEGVLELIGLHSCSMSSAEVAYELRDRARRMLASQGPAFVGSWPYREILQKVFKDQVSRENHEASAPSIDDTINSIFDYIYFTSYDFELAGYPFDLSLCDLTKISSLKNPLQALSAALTEALKDKTANQFIRLAHLEAQSFWQESYTDIYDFCLCLQKLCDDFLNDFAGINAEALSATKDVLAKISAACQTLVGSSKPAEYRWEPVVRSKFTGPQYQYSRGLSVYFPWAEPATRFWQVEYPAYAFEETYWRTFLENYFRATRREPIFAREEPLSLEQELLEEVTFQRSQEPGLFVGGPAATTLSDKPGANSATGIDSEFTGIKNYPSFTRKRLDVGAKEAAPPATDPSVWSLYGEAV